MADILVFLTATIHCGETPLVKRCDPVQREQDYLRAFRHWLLLKCDADILFCENSSADLSAFRAAAATDARTGRSVRLVSFAGNEGAQRYGKGYGEIEMLRYAFETFPELSNYKYIMKVSGRYVVKNGSDIVDRIRRMTADLICDMHWHLTYGDIQVAAFRPHVALTHLIPFQEEIDDTRGVFIEHVMARCVHRTLVAGGSWAPLPCTPYRYGVSGTWNTPERDSVSRRVKQDIKRKLAAWVYRY
jgi:hypothetical protein